METVKKNPILRYIKKNALPESAADQLPDPNRKLKLVVVIPCLAESQTIEATLDSLTKGSRRQEEAEVIVVVNHKAGADRWMIDDNLLTLTLLAKRPKTGLALHVMDRATAGHTLDDHIAGVGLARRIGMDQALKRLWQVGQVNRSAIACLDADATVAPGYIDHLLELFDVDKQPVGGICHFEHPLPNDQKLREGIIFYELWLRYLERGLAITGTPYAYHSIGSCMVVSAGAYAMADGMPLRQAAEDFHFLQKVAKISPRQPIIKIGETAVYPAARCSKRVLFGTGKAMLNTVAGGGSVYRQVAQPCLFFELEKFFEAFSRNEGDLEKIKQAASPTIHHFMQQESGWAVFERLKKNYRQPDRFSWACHQWFDGLKIIRFLNHYSADKKLDILNALPQLLQLDPPEGADENATNEFLQAQAWLEFLRNLFK